jgi:hypothetical protein
LDRPDGAPEASAAGVPSGGSRGLVPAARPIRAIRVRSLRGDPRHRLGDAGDDSYLVDSASSHMLVSRIKPCMSKYKQSIP